MGSSSTAIAIDRVGSTVAGKYHLRRLIGAGAMGAVYAAIHQFTGRHVALKLIDASFAEYEGFAARFLREARSAAEIAHPVICDVIDAGQEPDGSLYLVLELLEGRTLEEAIEAKDIGLDEVVDVGIQLSEGLAAAHDRGIVHRDIKPENVFLTWDGEGELHVKLLDFGVAKNTKGGAPELFATQQGAILGTPYYMAPEQAAGDSVDARADIWSLGAVLFHALTGRPPFDEDTYNRLISKLMNTDPPRLRALRPDVPEWLATAVDGALARDVEVRWQSTRTMGEALRRRGRGAIDLDWELHEDHTVRTDAMFDTGPEPPPAIAVLSSDEVPTIEVDIETTATNEMPAFDGGGGPTMRSDAIPPFSDLSDIPEPRPPSSGLWLGLVLGVLITAMAGITALILYAQITGA